MKERRMDLNGNMSLFIYIKKEMKTNITAVFKKEVPTVIKELSLLEKGF